MVVLLIELIANGLCIGSCIIFLKSNAIGLKRRKKRKIDHPFLLIFKYIFPIIKLYNIFLQLVNLILINWFNH